MASVNVRELEKFIWAVAAFAKKIAPFKDALDRVQPPIEEAIKKYENAMKGDLIRSDNETINKMWALAKSWKAELNPLLKKDENYWMDKSNVNILVRETIYTAVSKLQEIAAELQKIKTAADGCISLIYTLNVSDHMDIKGWGSMMVSTKALDIEARREAVREFRDCINMTDKILLVLNRSVATLQKFMRH